MLNAVVQPPNKGHPAIEDSFMCTKYPTLNLRIKDSLSYTSDLFVSKD